MILIYPLLLIGAACVAARRQRTGGRGWHWFVGWCVAGAIFTFSLLTGLSIGLFLLPVAAGALFVAAREAPHAEEAVGLVAGAGLVILIVTVPQGNEAVIRWPAGLVTLLSAVSTYAIWRRRAPS